MAKPTKDQQQAQLATGESQESKRSLPTREEGESLFEYAARVKTEAAAIRAESPRSRGNGSGGSTGSKLPRKLDREEAMEAWDLFSATPALISVSELAERLVDAGLWNEKEAQTVYLLSSLDQVPATQVQVAEMLGCNTWMVYNYRRDALVKLAELIEGDWEKLHETLSIRRGTVKPPRQSQYWPKVTEEEKALRKEAHDREVEQRKLDRQANRNTASKPSSEQ